MSELPETSLAASNKTNHNSIRPVVIAQDHDEQSNNDNKELITALKKALLAESKLQNTTRPSQRKQHV